LSENCPDVPIPHLFGYGLTSGQRVSLNSLSFETGRVAQRSSLILVG
jgi:hypothetical protein